MSYFIFDDISVSSMNVIMYCLVSMFLAEAFSCTINILDKILIRRAEAKGADVVKYYEPYVLHSIAKGKDVIQINGKQTWVHFFAWIIPLAIIGLEIYFEFSVNSTLVEEDFVENACWNVTDTFKSSVYFTNIGKIPELDAWLQENRKEERYMDVIVNGTVTVLAYNPYRTTSQCFNTAVMEWVEMNLEYNRTLKIEAGPNATFHGTLSVDIFDVFCNSTIATTINGSMLPVEQEFEGTIRIEEIQSVRLLETHEVLEDTRQLIQFLALAEVSYETSQGAQGRSTCVLDFASWDDAPAISIMSCDFNGDEYHRSLASSPLNDPWYDILVALPVSECLPLCTEYRQNRTCNGVDDDSEECTSSCSACRQECIADIVAESYCPSLFDYQFVMKGSEKNASLCDGVAYNQSTHKCLSMHREFMWVLTSNDLGDIARPDVLEGARQVYTGLAYPFVSDVAFQNNTKSLLHNHHFSNQRIRDFRIRNYVYSNFATLSGNVMCDTREVLKYISVPTVEKPAAIIVLVLLPLGGLLIVYETFFEHSRYPINRFRDLRIVDGQIRLKHEMEREEHARMEQRRTALEELIADPTYTLTEDELMEHAKIVVKLESFT